MKQFQYRVGFSLITMAVTLTIAALVFVSVLPGRDAGDANKKVITGIKRLDRVEEAMRGFMAANGRRPCPADGSAAVGSAGFGQESITGGVCNITAGKGAVAERRLRFRRFRPPLYLSRGYTRNGCRLGGKRLQYRSGISGQHRHRRHSDQEEGYDGNRCQNR
jgi:hypothetical protein